MSSTNLTSRVRLLLLTLLLDSIAAIEYRITPPVGLGINQLVGDPRASITCKGPLPPYPIHERGFNTYWPSLTHLCAKPAYGGIPNYNLGGYCWWAEEPLQVYFDPFRPSAGLLRTELFVYCQTRCFCTTNDNTHHVRRLDPAIEHAEGTFSGGVPTGFLNLENGREMPRAEWMMERGDVRAPAGMVIHTRAEIEAYTTVYNNKMRTWRRPIVPFAGEAIDCSEGSLPPFGLPRPFSGSTANVNKPSTLQQLCAAEVDGGSVHGSAGGVCVDDTLRSGRKMITFYDELAHPALTDRLGRGTGVRVWCYFMCKCTGGRSRDEVQRPETLTHLPWQPNVEVDMSNDNLVLKGVYRDNLDKRIRVFGPGELVIPSGDQNVRTCDIRCNGRKACAYEEECTSTTGPALLVNSPKRRGSFLPSTSYTGIFTDSRRSRRLVELLKANNLGRAR